ncbi:PKD domain protein [anaerobic digester metagenome]
MASNSAGTVYGADTAFSTETAPTLPTANFTANVTSGIAPLAVRFTDTSTGDPTSWSWTFGDGATSTEQHLVHTYTVSGTYTVSLTVMNSAGSDTMIRAGYIKVSPQQNILWEVPLSVASGTLSQTVTLGSAESATREFDAWLDVPMPPDAPGAKKSVYFTCPDPTFGELSADYRPPVDDANPEESWTLCIRSDEPVQVTWNTTTLSKSELFLTWNNGTNTIAMKATNATTLPAGSYSISISASTVQQMDLPLQVGWNLVSVPFNDAAYTVPQNSVLAIYGYNPSTKGYETVSRIESLVPGKAYWIASGRDCTVTVTGTPVSPVTAQLKQGWNLIGSAAGQSTFDSIAMTPAGSWAMPFVYGYDPQTKGYVQITELQPGKGYWGAVTRDCTITLS